MKNVERLLQGNEFFQKNYFCKHEEELLNLVSSGQHPKVLYIGCADSRVIPSLITNTPPGQPFLTDTGALLEATVAAVAAVNGQQPALLTTGGTSDGRFIAPTGAEVIELGPVNATIHKVNECVKADDLDLLADMYQGVLARLLA